MGKLKGKIIKSGDMGVVRVKSDSTDEKIEYPYNQPYSKELGITVGTVVNLDLVTVNGKEVAVAVNPIERGEISEINFDAGTGTVAETESGIKYPFVQPYLKDSGFAVGTVVNYSLVYIKDVATAVCLSIPVNQR